MKKNLLLLLLFALLCAACKSNAPTGIYAVSCSQKQAEKADSSVSFFTLEDEKSEWPGVFSSAFLIKNLRNFGYDSYDEPLRFDDDLSLWVTNDLSSQFMDAVIGRCIYSEEEIEFIKRTLIDAEYEETSEASIPMSSPVFHLRQGTECTLCNDRIREGETGYIDDMVFNYTVLPDGNVFRFDPEGNLMALKQPASPEDTACLYLIYTAYMLTTDVFYPGSFMETGAAYTLYVERGGKRIVIPKEKWADFIALVTVEEDRIHPEGVESPCCAVSNVINHVPGQQKPEVLRFLAVPSSEDIEAVSDSRIWFSLRENGNLSRIITKTAGALWPRTDSWQVRVRVLQSSKSFFDVSAINALVDSCMTP